MATAPPPQSQKKGEVSRPRAYVQDFAARWGGAPAHRAFLPRPVHAAEYGHSCHQGAEAGALGFEEAVASHPYL